MTMDGMGFEGTQPLLRYDDPPSFSVVVFFVRSRKSRRHQKPPGGRRFNVDVCGVCFEAF